MWSTLGKIEIVFWKGIGWISRGANFRPWCSLGLELLARSAISSISPTLLAEPDNEHKYLLHALNLGSDRIPRKSISSIQVLFLCKTLFPQFTEDDYTCAKAMINRRNEELHTGSASFESIKQQLGWPPSINAANHSAMSWGKTSFRFLVKRSENRWRNDCCKQEWCQATCCVSGCCP